MDIGQVDTFQDNACHGEDAFVVRTLGDRGALDCVFDGVTHCGGGYAGSFSADLLAEAAIEALPDVIAVLEQANQLLFQSGKGRNLLTTVSAVLYRHDHADVVSIGDSPAYLIRAGTIRALTPQPSPQMLPGLTGGAVGLTQRLRYASNAIDLMYGDKLLIATDGLVHNLTEAEIHAILAESATATAAVERIRDEIAEKRRLKRGREDSYITFKEDDQTAIVRFIL